jgi:hypothetical protein
MRRAHRPLTQFVAGVQRRRRAGDHDAVTPLMGLSTPLPPFGRFAPRDRAGA